MKQELRQEVSTLCEESQSAIKSVDTQLAHKLSSVRHQTLLRIILENASMPFLIEWRRRFLGVLLVSQGGA